MFRKSAQALIGVVFLLGLQACGEDEEAIMLANLQEDLRVANAAFDSLSYTLDSSNLLIDELRSRADSLQHVDAQLLQTVQDLNKEVRQWRNLYSEQKRKNEELGKELERMKREKQVDQQTIARLRSESDSLNTALLDAHTDIRRQSDHIRGLEDNLASTQSELEDLKTAQASVRVLMATEGFLKESEYLKTNRSLGKLFRTSFKLERRLDIKDPQVRKAPLGEPFFVEGKLKALVDRYGKLKEGRDYEELKENGQLRIVFVNDLLAGVDVLAVVE
jgi:chromosome segregation ATPase